MSHPPGLDPVPIIPGGFKPPRRAEGGVSWSEFQSKGRDGVVYACVLGQGLYLARKGSARLRGASLPLKQFPVSKYIVNVLVLPLEEMRWVETGVSEPGDVADVWEWLTEPLTEEDPFL